MMECITIYAHNVALGEFRYYREPQRVVAVPTYEAAVALNIPRIGDSSFEFESMVMHDVITIDVKVDQIERFGPKVTHFEVTTVRSIDNPDRPVYRIPVEWVEELHCPPSDVRPPIFRHPVKEGS